MGRRLSALRVAAKYKDKKEVPKSEGKGTTTVYEYGPRQVAKRHKDKAVRIEALRKKMSDLRQKARGDLTASDPETRLTALAVCLMDETYERVGNEQSAKDGHFGVTNWTAGHVTLGDKSATIRYTGKSGVKHEKKVTNARVLSALRKALKGKGKEDKILCDGDECSILAKDVNAYLKPYGVTAKDIRGLNANEEMKHHLKAQRKAGPADLPHSRKEKDEILKAEFQAALDLAAAAVGHESSTLRSQYLVPSMEEAYIHDGTVIDKLDKAASLRATKSEGADPWAKVRLPGFGLLWTEPVDSEDAFPGAIGSYEVVDGWIVYHGRNGSVGIVVGSPDELRKWASDVDRLLDVASVKASRLWTPDDGGEKYVKEAVRVAQAVLRALGESGAQVEVWVEDGSSPSGEASGSLLRLSNVHLGSAGGSKSFLGVKIPHYLSVAAHEAAHLGFHRGGRDVIEALRAFRKHGGEYLTTYHSLAGDFEGVMEAAAMYALRPDGLLRKAPEVYEAVQDWFGGRRVRTATLSDSEKEDREDEAQVRQSPKLKPPRTDKERRMVKDRDNSEDDPDARQDRKDRSTNYKDAAARVALRYLLAQDGEGEEDASSGKGGVSGKFLQFMEEEGDSEVKNPDTGNTVKLKSLKGDKGRKIQQQEFEKWLGKDKGSDEPSSSGSDGGGKDKEAPADTSRLLDEDTASAADTVAAAREKRKSLMSEDSELWDIADIRESIGAEFRAIPGLDSDKVDSILSKKVIVTPDGVYEPDAIQNSLYSSVSSAMNSPIDTAKLNNVLKSALSVDAGSKPDLESIKMEVAKKLQKEMGLDDREAKRISESIRLTDPRSYVGGLVKELTEVDKKAVKQFDKKVKDARKEVLDSVETLVGSSRQLRDLPLSTLMGVKERLDGSNESVAEALLDPASRSKASVNADKADKILEKVSDDKETTPSADEIADALIAKRTKMLADNPDMLNPTQPLTSLSLEPLSVPEGEEADFRSRMADRTVNAMRTYLEMDEDTRSKHQKQLESMLSDLDSEGHKDTEQYAAVQAQLRGVVISSALEDGDKARGVNQTFQKALQFARKDGRLDDFVRLNITGAAEGEDSAQVEIRKAIEAVDAEDLKEMLPSDHPGHELLDALGNETYLSTMDAESQAMLRELADDMILSEMVFTDMDLVKKGKDVGSQRKSRPPTERPVPPWKQLLKDLGVLKSASVDRVALPVSRWDFAPWGEPLSISSR